MDAIYSPSIGRRKSWIIPIQTLTAFLFLWLGQSIDDLMHAEHVPIYYLSGAFLVTIFFCATQDIAVDGWALTLLSKESLSYASTAQTIGLNTGYFLSFTVFLAFNSPEFSNKYLRSEPQELGVLQLGAYMRFWAVMYFAVTAYLLLWKKEDESAEDQPLGIRGVYDTIWKICQLPRTSNRHICDACFSSCSRRYAHLCRSTSDSQDWLYLPRGSDLPKAPRARLFQGRHGPLSLTGFPSPGFLWLLCCKMVERAPSIEAGK